MKSWPRFAKAKAANPIPVATYMTGTVYVALGLVMAVLGLVDALLGEEAEGFFAGALVGLGLGLLLRRLGSPQAEPRRAEALLTVAGLWLLVPALGAIPFWVSGGMSYLDALFEATSGFSTTGATVLSDFNQLSHGLFFWRSLSQWFGGMGILLLFIVVLPHLALAGRQMFFAEVTGVQKQQLTPKLRQTATNILRVYLVLTGFTLAAYLLTGVPFFEAFTNTLSSVSAGGFSPNPESFAAYSSLTQWAATLVMFLTGVNLLLQYRVVFGREFAAPLRDPEFRAYALIVVLVGLGIALILLLRQQYPPEAALRHAFFQTTSIITGTGFASADFAQWVVPAQVLLVMLMFIGGSAGSVGGSIKVIRWLIIAALVRRELQRALHPQAVLPLRVGHKNIGEDVLRAVAAFITLYVGLFALGVLVIGVLEEDFVVAFTASAAAIGNVGPGLGAVGPMSHYGELHPVSKAMMIFQMWAGRIELIAVFALFTPELWRRLRA
ncbi:TrkH family potassium uptake protein [Meiothermus sp. QL-1]|uniref:TrkH family potassium uptake protein n=1 Tax=Meiothermus sp. QL-1 TaxID=2058095 RepID=UPI000E0BD6FB|nr:TrkH family potassium uptake protein [Meiothermus sp. QL-1]RDI96660.1 TrkH family potassium uptake protein [Meiothermus sp. QL-1]